LVQAFLNDEHMPYFFPLIDDQNISTREKDISTIAGETFSKIP
jgi:hypothetical protein